jgi:hypothetical protein
MLRVRQRFDAERVDDVAAAVRGALARLDLGRRIRRGQAVAVAVGSRGIANLACIVRTLVATLVEHGAEPFVVPAMGSHGGGTADGQRQVLERYGLSEAALGVPIRSSMEVVELGRTEDGVPLLLDHHAAGADHVVLVNRIRPHVSFSGPIESGLMKLLMFGLGKRAGAAAYHRASLDRPFEHLVGTVGRTLLVRARVAFGLAILDNAHDETARVEALAPEALEARERELLVVARRWMPRLPVAEVDLLVVDEMGKNISGTGMDTTVTGRKRGTTTGVRVHRLFVRDLTPETRGNAHGIGLADFTTTRLVRAIDRQATLANALTALHPEAARIPLHFETDREAIDAALATIGLAGADRPRVVRIRNTRSLGEVAVSEACRTELDGRDDVRIVGPPSPLAFDGAGNLPPWDQSP